MFVIDNKRQKQKYQKKKKKKKADGANKAQNKTRDIPPSSNM